MDNKMNGSTNVERIIKKVQGLIRLSENNDNDEEAQTVFLVAQKLMIKNHISMSSIKTVSEEEESVNDENETINV